MSDIDEKNKVDSKQCCPNCDEKLPENCPKCGSLQMTYNGKVGDRQKFRCECGHQFISDPSRPRIEPREWHMVDSLLADDVEVAVIHQATGISKRHIYTRKSALEATN